MTKDDVKKAIKLLGGLFSGQITQEAAKVMQDDFREFEYRTAESAIKNHHRENLTLNYPALLEECRNLASLRSTVAAGNANTATGKGQARIDDSPAAIYRRLYPWLENCSDYEAIIRTKRQMWHKSTQTDSYRRMFATECYYGLVAAGMESDDARDWAETIFSPPEHFQRCLEELRAASGQTQMV